MKNKTTHKPWSSKTKLFVLGLPALLVTGMITGGTTIALLAFICFWSAIESKDKARARQTPEEELNDATDAEQ